LAGGVAGGVAVLVLKYIIADDVARRTIMMGASNVIANGLVMLSTVVLWISQNMEDEYAYNLAL